MSHSSRPGGAGFVIVVEGVTGGLLAVFAVLAGERVARPQGEGRPQR